MATTVELEIDDIHELMFQSLMQEQDDAPSLDEWAENTVEAILYQAYQNKGDQPAVSEPDE